jgi:hypothetical protein
VHPVRDGGAPVLLRLAGAMSSPLSPTDWKLTFDGVSVSLHPSDGNWSFPCRSHYRIEYNRA